MKFLLKATLVSILMSIALVACANPHKVSGQVVDADGKPVPFAQVGTYWWRHAPPADDPDKEMKLGPTTEGYRMPTLTADENGYFQGELEFPDFPWAITALDADQKRVGTRFVLAQDITEPIQMHLTQRMVEIDIELLLKDMPPHVLAEPGTMRAITAVYEWPMFIPEQKYTITFGGYNLQTKDKIFLPPGNYTFIATSSYSEQWWLEGTIPDADHYDMGVVTLTPTPLAKMKGNTPQPWNITAAKGLPSSVTSADLKGKWVFIDIWGYWCQPCVQAMPVLMDLYDEYSDIRDKFEIIGLHFGDGVSNFEELEPKIKTTREKIWGGRDPGYPILITDEQTINAWGIRAFPTMVIINPKGQVTNYVMGSDQAEKILRSKLQELKGEKK